jgi:hypothetical protein
MHADADEQSLPELASTRTRRRRGQKGACLAGPLAEALAPEAVGVALAGGRLPMAAEDGGCGVAQQAENSIEQSIFAYSV